MDALEALRAAQNALPIVPRPEDDCCTRLVERVEWIEDRETAREWIALLRALGLVDRDVTGYARVREDPDRDVVAARFGERIVGAAEAIDALGRDPHTATEAFAAIRSSVPAWERRRSDAWEDEWRARTERTLEWAVRLGLADAEDGGYVRA